MNEKIRVVQFGCGKMAKYLMKYVFEKGGEVVGAIDVNPDVVGKDIGAIMETESKNVYVVGLDKAEGLLASLKPDICIIATMSLVNDVKDAMLLCAKLGINAISTCEEAFYPFNSSPRITLEIDTLAKQNNCTISGSGYQDVFWGNLITVLSGASHRITKIKGSSSYNVEEYGIALAKAHGAGLDLETFEKEIVSIDNVTDEERRRMIDEGKFLPSYMWNTCGWLADKLGLTITSQVQKCVPTTHKTELKSDTLGMTIPAGYATGMSAVVTAMTKEGITIEAECIGRVYAPDEVDQNIWTIYGEPDTNVVITKPSTAILTCASIVNRIPDVINAPSGFVPTSRMPIKQYLTKTLNEYIKK